MFFRKLKEENRRLEKKVREIKAELADAQAIAVEMRKLLADKHTSHSHADTVEAVRSAIIRKCSQVRGCEPSGMAWIPNTDSAAAEILALVMTYDALMRVECWEDADNG